MQTQTPIDDQQLTPVKVSVAGQQLTIFVEIEPLVESMLKDIQRAQKRVWIETYMFIEDSIGRRVAEALKERAQAGVDVRVHYDAIGSLSSSTSFFQEMEEAGVKVHSFHSFWEALGRFSFFNVLNRRNHRKLLIVDDNIGYFGGMNIVDVSSKRTFEEQQEGPWSSGWRDVHVRLEGSQQPELAESFDRSWKRAHRERIPWRPASYRKALLSSDEEVIQFFDSGPGLRHTRAGRVFRRLIDAAQESITFSMAYFVPVGGVLRALFRARRRGVRIRTVVPCNNDVALVDRALRSLALRLLRQRFRVYQRQFNMLHSKVMIVDNQWTVLGSANLDARSMWINLEFMALIRSRTLAATMQEIIKYEMAHSRRMSLRECLRRGCWQRFVDRLAWSMRWTL